MRLSCLRQVMSPVSSPHALPPHGPAQNMASPSISLLPDCSNHSARYKSTCMKLKWVADLPKCLRLAR